jgi:hypothetical protein
MLLVLCLHQRTGSEGRDETPPSYEADLEGQLRLSDLDPVAKDGQGIAEISKDKKSVQWAAGGRERVESNSSRGSEFTFK